MTRPSRSGNRGRRSRLLLASAAAALALTARSAEAACSLSLTAGVGFGAYNIFAAAPVDSIGQFEYKCTGAGHPSVRITLSKGGSTTYADRRLTNGSEFLLYNLYLDAARTAIWGDETEGTQAYYNVWQGGNRVLVYVYGRIPPRQDAAVGTYADTVVVTLNY
jgi:spore coat protein U-like protein